MDSHSIANLTPETPIQSNVECKVIRLAQENARHGRNTPIFDMLQAIKAESEALLALVENHQRI